jgi:isoleucyl-tRNA synthetase
MYKSVKDFSKSDNYENYQVAIREQFSNQKFKDSVLLKNNGKNYFRFMDGPPFVTGNLHWGHLTIGSIKSTVLNYKRMKGFNCLNKLGYDTHGVPIESLVNSQLNIKSIQDLKTIGIETFNKTCKDNIHKFKGEWKPIYDKLGRWTNFDNTYMTMDKDFMESTWWAFSELYKKNLVYRSYKVSAYSTPLQSPLSNFETQQNYKKVQTKSIYVKFKVTTPDYENHFFVVWTTTPWTLPTNVALCVNSELSYDFVKNSENDTVYILESKCNKNADINGKTIKTVKGLELVGLKYEPVFNYYFTDLNDTAFRVVSDSYVTSCIESGIGTGIVHLSPAFGEDDYRVCMKNNIINESQINLCCPLNEDCIYNEKISDFTGKFILEANQDIIMNLKQRKLIQKIYSFEHEYPFCYRTDTPLIYRTINAVYIKVTDIKDKLLEMNSKINWYPEHIGNKRFNEWLTNVRDWCVSRSRYFGTPIPMWISDDGEIKVIGSIKQLEQYVGTELNLTDLHPEFIDNISFTINGKLFKRIPDVFDCWFESGCVPYGQLHYPFENQNYFDDKEYLSDFIVEGLDQTRGWFYTLLVLSTALFEKPAFKQVNVVGLVLDENGEKFSKKKKNYVDANIAIEQDGADVLRMYVMNSGLTYGEPLKFKHSEVIELKQKFIQLINCAKFYVEHSINLEKQHNLVPNINIVNQPELEENFLNSWIWEEVQNLSVTVTENMDKFNLNNSIKPIIDFIEDITNYYIKLNRESLKGIYGVEEWTNSLGVLYNVLKKYCIILAPFAPFTSEYLYEHIKQIDLENLESVHYYEYPVHTKKDKFSKTFNLLKRILKIVRGERYKSKTHSSLKTPIKECKIRMNNYEILEDIKKFIHLISPELNCIDLTYGTYDEEIEYTIDLDFKQIGKQFKKEAVIIRENIKYITQVELVESINTGVIIVKSEENQNEFKLEQNMFSLRKVPKNKENTIIDNELMIQLDLTYNDDIMKHYTANCFVTHFQAHRKRLGLRPWNKVECNILEDENSIISSHNELIQNRLKIPVYINKLNQDTEQNFKLFTETFINDCINIKYELLIY